MLESGSIVSVGWLVVVRCVEFKVVFLGGNKSSYPCRSRTSVPLEQCF